LCRHRLQQTTLPLFDVAFLDMQMPKMDGAELGRKIRSNSALNTIKLVMMTSISQGNEARFFADIGFNAYFPKPATTSDLFDALAVVMDKDEQAQTKQIVTHDYLQSFTHSTINNNETIWPENTRILLVEDNRINQQVALGILEHFNLTADIAINGIEALAALQSSNKEVNSKPFTLVLMDCQMPEMDGYQTSREIRSNKTVDKYCDIPIIAMTANAMEGDKEKCLAAGMSDYLAKPITPELLKEKLQHWLGVNKRNDKTKEAPTVTKHYQEVEQHNSTTTASNKNNTLDMINMTDQISTDEMTRDNALLHKENNYTNNDNTSKLIWDKAACLNRVSNNQALLMSLIGIFIEDTPKMITDLAQAVELNTNSTSKQYQKIYNHAHALKGVSGNLSGLALHQVASKLEIAAKNNNQAEVNELYLKLKHSYQELLKLFESFLTSV